MMKKTILITGGSGLIGLRLVSHYLSNNYKVVCTVSSLKSKSKLEKDFYSFIQEKVFFIFVFDFNKKEFSEKLIEELVVNNITPYALINNARNIENLDVNNEFISEVNWLKEFNIAVIASYKIVIGLIEMKKSQLKRVINISSIYGVVAVNSSMKTNKGKLTPMHYGVCKAALIHLTKELTAKYGKKLTFNSVSFGGVEGRASESFKKKYSNLCPNGRMLLIDEIIEPINFLLSSNSSGINGHNLVVDGGWTIW